MYRLFRKIIIVSSLISNLFITNFAYCLPDSVYLKAYHAFKNGDMKNAIIYLGQLINTNKADKAIYEKLVYAYLVEDDFADAYKTAIYSPKHQANDLMSYVAIIYKFKVGDFKYFIKSSNKFAKDSVEWLSFNYLKAFAYYKRHNLTHAIELIKEAQDNKSLALTANDEFFLQALALYNMALLYQASNAKLAEKYFLEALDIQHNSQASIDLRKRILVNYVALLEHQHRDKEAAKFLTERSNLDKTANKPSALASELLSNLASFLAASQNLQLAWTYSNFALSLDPYNNYGLWQYARLVNLRNVNHEKDVLLAISLLDKVNYNSPYYYKAKNEQALLAMQIEDFTKAIAILSKLKIRYKKDPEKLESINYFLFNSYVKKQDYTKAASLIEPVLQKSDANDWLLNYEAGVVYHKLGAIPKALHYLELAANKAQQNAEVLNYYGYLGLENNAPIEKVLPVLKRAALLAPRNGYVLDSLGVAYSMAKQYAQALDYLQLAAQIMPFDSVISEHLGDAYWRSGDKMQARYEWQHTINLSKNRAQINEVNVKVQNGLF